MGSSLTGRQQEILDFILGELHRKGYPPSVREIGQAVGLSSSSTVHSHLSALEKKGFIRRDPTKPRALEVLNYRNTDRGVETAGVRNLPLVGQVAAGVPILAQENIEDVLPLPIELATDENSFLLRVRGESMIDAGILDGDILIIRQQQTADNGDIVVAMIEAALRNEFKREVTSRELGDRVLKALRKVDKVAYIRF
ncbi:MAG: transcriptional repressor LexA, partial [Chloroflexi bacterium]|nr:transcriptional repressor LexA [Chloroflexota bacterium]